MLAHSSYKPAGVAASRRHRPSGAGRGLPGFAWASPMPIRAPRICGCQGHRIASRRALPH